MFSFRTTSLLEQQDITLKKGNIGILCNQSSWNPITQEYLFNTLVKTNKLKRIFYPDNTSFCDTFLAKSEIEQIELNYNTEEILTKNPNYLSDLDALIIEIQDNGCRYSKYISILYSIFKVLKNNNIDIPIYIVDKPNPSGRQVEGTMLRAGYRSNIGIEGILHKHGLTIGEELYFIYNEMNAKFPLHIISYKTSAINKELLPWSIPISFNYSGFFSSSFYCGQKLWEATNISCGKGTNRPYEIFGAPFIKNLMNKSNWNSLKKEIEQDGVLLRETIFIPSLDKYIGEKCYGFQLLLKPNMQYHSLAHNLRIMRFLYNNCKEFSFKKDVNLENDKTTLENMLGDKDLIDYVMGEGRWEDVKEHIKIEEQKWIKKAKKAILYKEELLYRIK